MTVPEYNGIGVYSITNPKNGKRYIGSSVHVGSRIRQHLSAIRNLSCNNLMLEDVKLGHEFIAEIIEEIPDGCTSKFLQRREAYYIDKYKSNVKKFGYNSEHHYPFKGAHETILISNYIAPQKDTDKITIDVPKGRKQALQAHAKQANESLNQFTLKSVDERMGRLEGEGNKVDESEE